ncbi:unnamed protein product [Rotaria socialis]|uniref:Uncharacterized protein n=1 Tax=Rotaria socialis TaxID=392032 RepID=A0A818VPT2_9BILA|nr:unnamed protein product [Rotaria socialis]CAF3714248.1 unnamed protein product [Rotaria socialis]CAF4278296.1 unnamed protein product [Rotaria socialis]CAF4529258.1 unnamed protein product [Rotaria socialis]
MISYLGIIITIIFTLEFCSVLTIDIHLTQSESNLLYSHLQTPIDLSLFYRKLLRSNGIDDVARIQHIVTQDDIQKFNLVNKCFKSSDDLLNALKIIASNITGILTRSDVDKLSPALIDAKVNIGCAKSGGRVTWKNVLIGLLTVTFINCSALCGAIILPFRNKPTFKWVLSGFIGLAVGTLTGSGIFHLIPMAFNTPDRDPQHTYLDKALITMIIIYIFYMRDQLLRIFLNVETIICTHTHGGDDHVLTESNCHGDSIPSKFANSKDVSITAATEQVFKKSRTRGLIENLKKMKAAGWMIFIGDMLHNFIDGLTLGAAFMVSIGEGLRLSLPIIFEEFPHELGDIAVLLSSGLTIGQALVMNFLSACSCYFGFILGAKLGELEHFHPWIYALAGGMFVYIGLADMIPELVAMGDEIEKDYIEAKKPVTIKLKLNILLCQNSGLILGFVIMFVLGKYGEHLENLVKL